MRGTARSLPDYYAFLGVPRNASEEEIRRRYRELARVYHPDVNPDKAKAHEQFLLLNEAYRTLTDPLKRMSYDLALARAERLRQQEVSLERSSRRPKVEALLVEAEARFFRREFEEAISLCQQALRLDSRNAAIYALLGDIYTELGKLEDAVVMYTYAVQYKPESQLFAQKLQQVLDLEKARKEAAERKAARQRQRRVPSPTLQRRPWVWSLTIVGLAIATVLWAKQPAESLWWGQIPPRLLGAGAVVGMGLGLLLRRWRFLGPFESEFLFSGVPTPHGGVLPIGALLSVVALLSFYLAVLFYGLIAFMEEHTSASILKVFACAFLLLGLFSLLWLPLWKWIVLFGGNLLFNALVLGWLLGEVGMKPWE